MIIDDLENRIDERISVGELREALGDRSFATLLVFFSLINMLPLPPGSTLITGIPLILLSVQMALGRRAVWLPRFVVARSLSADQFRRLSERLVPMVRWIEQYVRPRYWPFAREHADRVIGLFALVMSIAVFLPIPFGNWFPALTCALVGLAHSERDGLLFAISIVSGVFSLAFTGLLVSGAGLLASMLIG